MRDEAQQEAWEVAVGVATKLHRAGWDMAAFKTADPFSSRGNPPDMKIGILLGENHTFNIPKVTTQTNVRDTRVVFWFLDSTTIRCEGQRNVDLHDPDAFNQMERAMHCCAKQNCGMCSLGGCRTK